MKKQESLEISQEDLLNLLKKEFGERYEGEYALIHAAEKPDPCLYALYCNPVQTPSLAYSHAIRDGFKLEIHSQEGERVLLDAPEDSYDILLLADNPSFQIRKIYSKTGLTSAVVEENLVILKIQNGFPTDKEITHAFKPQKAKPTRITAKNKEITVEKPETRQTTTEEKQQNQNQIIKKLKARFKKTCYN